MNDIILETERLLLRYQRNSDLNYLIDLWTDNEITKYVGGPRDRRSLIKSFNEIAINPMKEEYDLWFINLKTTQDTIGMAGLLDKIIGNEKYYEINYYVFKKYWNNGYAAEISKGIIEHFKKKNKIKTFIAIIDKENTASIKTAEKIGMTYWKTELRSKGEKEIYKGEFY
ncbi:MAG: GNAT family N-acetyltransferase [Treponema sp.]|nr:GNAT family N-acetyltransferase [Treponema sp.]